MGVREAAVSSDGDVPRNEIMDRFAAELSAAIRAVYPDALTEISWKEDSATLPAPPLSLAHRVEVRGRDWRTAEVSVGTLVERAWRRFLRQHPDN